MSKEKIFANGFSFKRNEKAPSFVVGNLSVKKEDAIEFLNQHEDGGYVNLNINMSKNGAYYVELDTWKPTQQPRTQQSGSEAVPF